MPTRLSSSSIVPRTEVASLDPWIRLLEQGVVVVPPEWHILGPCLLHLLPNKLLQFVLFDYVLGSRVVDSQGLSCLFYCCLLGLNEIDKLLTKFRSNLYVTPLWSEHGIVAVPLIILQCISVVLQLQVIVEGMDPFSELPTHHSALERHLAYLLPRLNTCIV